MAPRFSHLPAEGETVKVTTDLALLELACSEVNDYRGDVIMNFDRLKKILGTEWTVQHVNSEGYGILGHSDNLDDLYGHLSPTCIPIRALVGYVDDCFAFSKKLFSEMLFTDMHLITEHGDEISCHRAVLCAASSVFRTMLTSEFQEASHAEVTIHDATARDIHNLLAYIYHGSISWALELSELATLVQLGDMYDILGLVELSSSRLVELVQGGSLEEGNVMIVLKKLHPYHQAKPALEKLFAALFDAVKNDEALLLAVVSQAVRASAEDQHQFCLTSDQFPHWVTPSAHLQPEVATTIVPEGSAQVVQPSFAKDVEIEVVRLSLPLPGLESMSEHSEETLEIDDQSILSATHDGHDGHAGVPDVALRQDIPADKITSFSVLSFNRCTPEFTNALLESELAKLMLEQGAEIEPSWANGARVLAAHVDPDLIQRVVSLESLRPWHVIIRSDDEPRVLDALRQISYSRRPRVRRNLSRQVSGARASMTNPQGQAPMLHMQADNQEIDRDAAGTIHYRLPPPVSPRSYVTAPP